MFQVFQRLLLKKCIWFQVKQDILFSLRVYHILGSLCLPEKYLAVVKVLSIVHNWSIEDAEVLKNNVHITLIRSNKVAV